MTADRVRTFLCYAGYMNYRFENIYTRADAMKRHIQAADHLGLNSDGLARALIVMVVQFSLWSPILYFSTISDIPFFPMALLLFGSFVLIGGLYDKFIMPHVAAYFDRKNRPGSSERSQEIIDIDDERITVRENDQQIIFNWSGVRSVEDDETTVFLFTEKGFCSIPSKCFPGFLEKDAFVRACREKISGYTEQGACFG